MTTWWWVLVFVGGVTLGAVAVYLWLVWYLRRSFRSFW